MTNTERDLIADALAVERHACPRCGAPAGSPCRTNNGTVAPTYHTARHVLVPALRDGLGIRTPRDRRPGKRWEQLAELPPEQTAGAAPSGGMIRVNTNEKTPAACSASASRRTCASATLSSGFV